MSPGLSRGFIIPFLILYVGTNNHQMPNQWRTLCSQLCLLLLCYASTLCFCLFPQDFCLEPISNILTRPRCEMFFRTARRDEEISGRSHSSEEQHGISQKQPQPLRDMANLSPRGVASDLEYRGYTLVLASCATKDWPTSRPGVLLRWVLGCGSQHETIS